MSVGILPSGLASDRWLAVDRMAVWEQALVVKVERNAAGTVLRLRLAEVPDDLPGQYYLVRLAVGAPPGVAEQAYSLCSSPYPPSSEVEIAVREVPGGRVSPLLVRQVEVGDLLQVRGAFGFLTWTERDGGPVGLIGAGTGVGPLAAIVRYAAARRLEVPMTLLRSDCDRTTALLSGELETLSRDMAWFRLVSTVTRGPYGPSTRFHRRIDADMLAEVFMAEPYEQHPGIYYVAGPRDLVVAARAMLVSLGVADGQIFREIHA